MIHFDLRSDSGVPPADALLVEGLRAGEEAAYEELIERFSQPVYNLVCRLLSDPEDASDVVQEVFLKVFRGVNSFRAESGLKTWIYRISINAAHNHHRWFHRRKSMEVALDDEQTGGVAYEDVLADTGRNPFELAFDRESLALLEEALGQVKPAYRAALILRDVESLSYEEVAAILEVSMGTVKSRIVRGREAMRTILTDRLERPPRLELATEGAQS